jgi:transposase
MNRLQLTPAQRRRLEAQLRHTRDAAVYRRTLALLEVARGEPIAGIAGRLHVSRASIYHWLDRFQASADPQTLAQRAGAGRPSAWSASRRAALDRALAGRPGDWGYLAVEWTVPLLRDYLADEAGGGLADDTIRRELHRRGFVWKRPRYVLVPDPQREKKTADRPPRPRPAGPCRRAV